METTIPAKQRTSSNARRAAGLVAALAFGISLASGARAQTSTAADCTIVGVDEVAQILGFEVTPADESSRAGGICFFPSHAISEEGSASYAIVDADDLQQRRSFFAALARRCGAPAPGAPREVVCKAFAELAQVKDVDAYYATRTDFPNAESEKGLGDAAVAAGDALYVKRGGQVFEVVVRRGDALDLDRTIALAKLLLSRTPPVPDAPEPTPSPRRQSSL